MLWIFRKWLEGEVEEEKQEQAAEAGEKAAAGEETLEKIEKKMEEHEKKQEEKAGRRPELKRPRGTEDSTLKRTRGDAAQDYDHSPGTSYSQQVGAHTQGQGT